MQRGSREAHIRRSQRGVDLRPDIIPIVPRVELISETMYIADGYDAGSSK